MENKFKVGDIVRGTENKGYSITNEKMTRGKVTRIYHMGQIEVEVLEHKCKEFIGNLYDVDPKDFELLTITKGELQEGDIITLRNGDKLILLEDGYFKDIAGSMDNYISSRGDLNKDLTYIDYEKDMDVVKVERPTYTTIFERNEEVKEMTLKEVCNALGYEVKIVKEEN